VPDLYRIRITPRALRDLEKIFDDIRSDSPQNASTMIARILDAIDDLEFMPSQFRAAGRSRKYGNVMHSRVVRPYIVYYRIDEDGQAVFIVEVRHGARRQPRQFD
jgi:plasmid stabilization system protein ParE